MTKPFLLVTAPVETRSGYGNHARDICRALIESEKYDIAIQSVPWGSTPTNALNEENKSHREIQKRIVRQPQLPKQPDLHYHIVIPNEFQPIAKKNVGITAGIEATVPPAPIISGATPPVIVDIPVVAIPPLALVNTENVAPSPPKLEVAGTA